MARDAAPRRGAGVRRWFVVGNDYVWPRRTARAAQRYALRGGGQVVGRHFLPLDAHDFTEVLRRIEHSDADAVLMLLVGADAVRFNRAFARSGLDQRCLRLSTLMDENMLLASGAARPAAVQHCRFLRRAGDTGEPRLPR
ncbi:ABC transporter substrate-binding protein [Micromonospora sp. M12]